MVPDHSIQVKNINEIEDVVKFEEIQRELNFDQKHELVIYEEVYQEVRSVRK